VLAQSAAALAEHAGRVSLVNQQHAIVFFGEHGDFKKGRAVAVHAE
jgi:hypothetical protein